MDIYSTSQVKIHRDTATSGKTQTPRLHPILRRAEVSAKWESAVERMNFGATKYRKMRKWFITRLIDRMRKNPPCLDSVVWVASSLRGISTCKSSPPACFSQVPSFVIFLLILHAPVLSAPHDSCVSLFLGTVKMKSLSLRGPSDIQSPTRERSPYASSLSLSAHEFTAYMVLPISRDCAPSISAFVQVRLPPFEIRRVPSTGSRSKVSILGSEVRSL